jgi:hypothetical protein
MRSQGFRMTIFCLAMIQNKEGLQYLSMSYEITSKYNFKIVVKNKTFSVWCGNLI